MAFEENKTVNELSGLFPLSFSMNEWAGNSEYYARLSKRLETSDAKTHGRFSAGDIALYNNISLVIFYADSFVLVHMTGTRMNKEEYLAAVKDGTLNYYSAEHDDFSVKVSGNKASLCGKSRVNVAVYGGGKHTWRLQQDMTLEKIGGEWKFTYSKASTY